MCNTSYKLFHKQKLALDTLQEIRIKTSMRNN